MMLHPWELDQYTFSDLLCKIKGFEEGRKERMKMVRRIAFASLSPWVDKHMTEERYWPLEGKQSTQVTIEEALALKQRYIDAGHLHPIKNN